MLKNDVRNEKLFEEMACIAEGLGMYLVDVYRNVKGPSEVQVCLTVMMKSGETGVDELTAFHRAAQSRLELEIGRDVLSMEVSSPGLQRTLKDWYEFSVFTGKRCRVYSQKYSSWVEGTIGECEDSSLMLLDCVVIDTGEAEDCIKFDFADVQKAKLEYKWSK